MRSRALLRLIVAVLATSFVAGPIFAATPASEIVRYEADRLTVRVTDVPLDRLVAAIAAATHATIRGNVAAPPAPVSFDFGPVPLLEGLTRILGAESFMLTYGADGTVRTIELLGRGVAPSSPVALTSPSPRPPLAAEEEQATVLQRPVAISGALARALGSNEAPVGRVLHAAIQERDPAARSAARAAALAAFARDPAAEAAYLSTLTPVEDDVLAKVFRSSEGAAGSAEEWMAALASSAPSAVLRAKAAAVLGALQR